MSTVHVVGPAEVSDPARPSGGNTYHRMMCAGLADRDWTVHERLVASARRTAPESVPAASLAETLDAIPTGDVVLLDGLVTASEAAVVESQAGRLRLVLVLHLPHGLDGPEATRAGRRANERTVLDAVSAVVVTSEWTRDWLTETYAVEPSHVRVAAPGVLPADPTVPSGTGGRLLCVGPVTATKGHDLLVAALASVVDLEWSCRCVGSLEIEPKFARLLAGQLQSIGLGDRVSFTGPQPECALGAEYAAADLLVVGSRTETYGMVVGEALAHAVPVLAAAVGGLPEAMGTSPDGRRPGLLVPSDDPLALGGALRDWLSRPGLRAELRSAAAARRATLRGWSDTAGRISAILTEVAA